MYSLSAWISRRNEPQRQDKRLPGTRKSLRLVLPKGSENFRLDASGSSCSGTQATSSNPDARKIEVEVELGGKGASFLVVRDNGGGMNASGLKDFATYFLTQVLIRLCIPE